MTNLLKIYEENENHIKKEFKCTNCDGGGVIGHQTGEDEWETEQCQYCYQFVFPVLNLNKQSQLALIDGVIAMVEESKLVFYKGLGANVNSVNLNTTYNQALSDLKDKLLAERQLINDNK